MAKIVWKKKAEQMFYARVEYAYLEFGTKTAQKWQADRILIEHQLRLYPESFTPERLLVDRKRLYRSCHIMDRFKIVYYYAKSSDTVHIVDIWDSKMSPENLKKRIR